MKNILKKLEKPMKDIPKKMTKQMSKMTKQMTKMIKPISKAIKMIIKTMTCSIKLIMNLPKCFIFYWLDMLKYTLFYLPILILMGMVGLSKEWIPIQKKLDKLLSWPNKTQNQCYRCKNINKKDDGFFDKLKKMMEKKNDKGKSSFTFFTFLIVCLFGGAFGYTFWFVFIRK